MAVKECPMCGEFMRMYDRTVTERLPGSAQSRTTQFHEWVCPECDYFEETEELAEAE